MAILKSCSGYEPFHKKYRPPLDVGVAVPDFLIFDQQFPRSVAHCLACCREAAHAISGRPLGQGGNEVEKLLAELTIWLNGTDITALTAPDCTNR